MPPFSRPERAAPAFDSQIVRVPERRQRSSQLALSSLGTCLGLYVLVYCKARGIPTDSLAIVHEQLHEPGDLRLRVNVVLPPGFPERHVDAVRAAARAWQGLSAAGDRTEVEIAVLSAERGLAVPA